MTTSPDELQLGGDAHRLLEPFHAPEPPTEGDAGQHGTGHGKAGEGSAATTRPSFVFLGVVAALTLAADIFSKAWAEVAINRRGFEPIEIIDGYFSVILAYNRGGAWGLFHDASELVRRPFFLCVSAAAILFIVSLYAKLVKSQRALTWGLPLVLGGALGNLSDRISRSQVIDFLDYRADWVLRTNAYIRTHVPGWTVTDHWPTFNVADIAICIGVGLMALDMMSGRKRHLHLLAAGGPELRQDGSLQHGSHQDGQHQDGQHQDGSLQHAVAPIETGFAEPDGHAAWLADPLGANQKTAPPGAPSEVQSKDGALHEAESPRPLPRSPSV